MQMRKILQFILVTRLKISCSGLSMNVEDSSVILEKMLTNYRKEVVPIYNNKPVMVETNLRINDMVPLEKIELHFSVDCTLRMTWVDKRLAFNTSTPSRHVSFDATVANQIWIPNIYFPVAKKGVIHSLIAPNIFVLIYGDGRVKFSERLSILSFCPMEFDFYPFDIQECVFKLECFAQSREYVRLTWGDQPIERAGHDLYISDYNDVKIDTDAKVTLGDFNKTFDTLLVTFTLYRDFTVYFLRDFFPCILIVALSWVSFFLSYKATPARVAFGITTVLTIVTMTNSIRSMAPSAKTFRSLDYYMLICMMFVFGALGEYAIVGMTAANFVPMWRNKGKKKATKVEENELTAEETIELSEIKLKDIKRVQTSKGDFGPLFRARVAKPSKASSSSAAAENDKTPVKFKIFGPFKVFTGDQHCVDNCAKIFFPLMFLFANAIYFSYHRIHPETVD